MTGTAFFFVLVGVGVASANLMKLVEWLDTPHEDSHRRARFAAESKNAIEFPNAELELESALYAS